MSCNMSSLMEPCKHHIISIIYMIGLLGMSLIYYRASLDWIERVLATTCDNSRPLGNHPVIASRVYSQQSPTCTRDNQMYLIPIALVYISCFACGRGLINGSA